MINQVVINIIRTEIIPPPLLKPLIAPFLSYKNPSPEKGFYEFLDGSTLVLRRSYHKFSISQESMIILLVPYDIYKELVIG